MLGIESHVLQQFLSVLLLGNTEKGWPGRILQMGFFFKVGIQPKEIKSWMTGGQSGALLKVWPLSCLLIYGKAQVAGKLLQGRNVWRNWLIYGKACPSSRAWTNPGWTLKQPGNSCYCTVIANTANLLFFFTSIPWLGGILLVTISISFPQKFSFKLPAKPVPKKEALSRVFIEKEKKTMFRPKSRKRCFMKSLILPLKNYIPATQMPKCLSHPLHKIEATKQHSLRAASSLVWSVLQQEVKGHPGMFGGTLRKADTSVGESLAQWPQFLWCCVHEFAVQGHKNIPGEQAQPDPTAVAPGLLHTRIRSWKEEELCCDHMSSAH